MSEWAEAPDEVISNAKKLIEEFHPWLFRANIAFVMKSDKKFKIKPYQKWANCSKIPQKFEAFLDYDFLIWIQEEIWEKLSEDAKTALIDHELSHCGYNENDIPILIPHDFEEFSDVIQRHGLWRPSLVMMGEAVKGYVQPKLIRSDR